jgi:dTDP-glucose 4,6-dehydratase
VTGKRSGAGSARQGGRPGRAGRAAADPLAEDLDRVLEQTRGLWDELRGGRVFLTGGTGFFGCWLLETLLHANEALGLEAKAVVLTRDPGRFGKKAPHLAGNPAVRLHRGGIRNFRFPRRQFSHLIHAAGYQPPAGESADPLRMTGEMIGGTDRVLRFCAKAGVRKMLLVSTGAVYGACPPGLERIPETFAGSVDPASPSDVYRHVRRMMETLTVLHAAEGKFEAKVARCFSFLGPYLPLDGRFAAGDFIRDALAGGPIVVQGSGKAVRSYLYAADLAAWLWTILFRGESGRPYNVGSETPVTIRRLAEAVSREHDPPPKVLVRGKDVRGAAPDHYVPDTSRTSSELGLKQEMELEEAIRKTMRWNRISNRQTEK